MALRYAAQTDIGSKREANEDFLAVQPARGLFVVADGLGGHVAGRRASQTGVGAFLDHLAEGAPSMAAARGAVRAANDAIRSEAEGDPQLRGMGTTLVALWLSGEVATLVNVGDSRVYVLRGGRMAQVTLDHSVVSDLISRGELDPADAPAHPQRHVITRALGVARSVEPDVACMRAQPGDGFLLCTDGIHAQLSDEEIRGIALAPRGLESAALELVEAANAKGGEDNASVVLVRLSGDD